MGELWERDASALAAMISSREVSSVEVVRAHLDRVEAVNPSLNAVVRVMADSALERARELDALTAEGTSVGPFHGVPITVKENLDIDGLPTTSGIVALAEVNAAVDAPVVERMKQAGAVPFARTNLPDMGLRLHTESGLHGTTLNPWDAERTVGGSSGGEAVALATGMSPFGIGNDIGGSLRNPANCCGIASLKPTTGVIAAAATVPLPMEPVSSQLMLSDGPMARSVRDLRRGLAAMAGRHRRDPKSLPIEVLHLEHGPSDLSHLRIAVMSTPPGGETNPSIAALIEGAAKALESAGCEVVEAVPPRFEEAAEVWATIMNGDLTPSAPLVMSILSENSVTFAADALNSGSEADLAMFVGALMARNSIARDWADFFGTYDLVLSPTWTELPFELGWDIAEAGRTDETMRMARPVLPANLLGLPSACVPCGQVDGLPVGALLTGDRFSERVCLDVAQAIENAFGVITPLDPH